jgi:50S ribosomal protein L16 3-hydroxylase
MDIQAPLPLLGGMSPARFMARHWQRKPLLVRQAIPGFSALLDRRALFALAGREGVESRLVQQTGAGWKLRHGPFGSRALPPVSRALWTLLVQGVDLHDDGVHALMQQFRFVPDARLDDLMISYATDGGGVGPHFDSYDVFLLQAHGRRRWRIGRQRDLSLQEGLPLKILARFEPEQEWVLEPGDLLYLPPRYAHDGIAEGECMTYSIGFRSPAQDELARELLPRLLDDDPDEAPRLYQDPSQPAVGGSAAIPEALAAFAHAAVERAARAPGAIDRALGEYLTEPKANVWFEAGRPPRVLGAVRLDRRTRMLHDARHVFINGESYAASGRDAALMRRLADRRALSAREVAAASEGARALLRDWCEDGWVQAAPPDEERS